MNIKDLFFLEKEYLVKLKFLAENKVPDLNYRMLLQNNDIISISKNGYVSSKKEMFLNVEFHIL